MAEHNVPSELADFDNRLINGLDFCRGVYDLFEQVRKGPNGIKRLRLRKGRSEKKLIEELIPIARYVQERYSHGRQLRVRWIDGGQQYDACLLSSGALVERQLAPKRQYLEVTTAVHENDHLSRSLLDKQGHSFGVKGISLSRKTKQITSRPYVYTGHEAEDDLANRILERIRAKTKINYPRPTVLVVQCSLDRLFLEDEWARSIARVKEAKIVHRFCEVFILDANHHYSATIHRESPRSDP